MKKLIFIIALTTIMMAGCKTNTEETKRLNGFDIVVIDNCEYLKKTVTIGGHSGYGYLAHKGNCKYCEQRLRQIIWEVQDSILNTMD